MPIYGTLVTSAIALIIAVPVSIGIALFLTDIAPRWTRGPIAIAIELLAAIPEHHLRHVGPVRVRAVHGDKCRTVVSRSSRQQRRSSAPLFTGPPIGIGMLTAGIVLGIMVIPFIAAVAARGVQCSPAAAAESAVALGSTRWEVLRSVTLPYTRSAVIGAIFLGLGRALGETMAVTFVLGNAHDLSASLLMPSNSIAAAIANEFTEADTDLYRSSLIALGFLLFVVTFIVLTIAKLLLLRSTSRWEGRTDGNSRRRRIADVLAFAFATAATLFGLVWLFWILWTTLRQGAAALNPTLFTNDSAAGLVGRPAQCLLRQPRHDPLAIMIGTPIGVAAGTYLAEHGRNTRVAAVVGFINDILLSAPSIVIGLFVYELVVRTVGPLFGLRRRALACIILVPIVVRTTQEIPAPDPRHDARGGLRARPSALARHSPDPLQGGDERDPDRDPARSCADRGRPRRCSSPRSTTSSGARTSMHRWRTCQW